MIRQNYRVEPAHYFTRLLILSLHSYI